MSNTKAGQTSPEQLGDSTGGGVESKVVEAIVQQNLGVYRASPSRLKEDVSQEAQVASDYRGRLVYELLQNADDAMEASESDSDRVVFAITDDALWMANSGRPLTGADVQGLCGLGASSKVDTVGTKRASIGHKGLGFKSVLEITDSPAVYSQTFSFQLGTREARPHVDALCGELGLSRPESVPAMRFPSPINMPENCAKWTAFCESGLNTAFRFPFRENFATDHIEALTDLLLGLPLTTVLFLKHLESVEVQVDQAGRTERQEWMVAREIRQDDKWLAVPGLGDSGLYRVTVSSSTGERATFYVAHDENVPIGSNREGLSGPAWEGVGLTEVSIAVLTGEMDDQLPEEWRHFHVFLPTEERCPYPILVNGAFVTDLSRQQIRVHSGQGDYNSHLVDEAARLFVKEMLPELQRVSVERVLMALDRGEDPEGGEAALLFHSCLVSALSDVPLIPMESGQVRPIADCALPSPLFGSEGELFRNVLVRVATWGEAEFPAAEFCRSRWARVATDHGAHQLTPSECLEALDTLADPHRSAIKEHESGFYEVDPVLDLSALLWDRADAADRTHIKAVARVLRLYPIHRNDDGSIERVALGEDTAFYPPQSIIHDLPLRDLQFMCHSICWGALNGIERNSMLRNQLSAWSAIFDIRDFRFQEVMQTSVLPALNLNPSDEDLSWRKGLQNKRSLAAICQLAGGLAKPDRPLRYQRLQNDRPYFNLSRLPVPCIGSDGEELWVPAYRAYFGRTWLGDDSFEHVVAALPSDTTLDIHFLAPPDHFRGLLDSGEQVLKVELEDDDEVGLNEDVDRSLETDEIQRWINFLSWIGVNRSMRLIHFHDVEDRNTGWLTTGDLQQPQGWAFVNMGKTWKDYQQELQSELTNRLNHNSVVPYLYEVHDLDFALPLIQAAERDASTEVASRLFEHLVKHWRTYSQFTDAHLALVDRGRIPQNRKKPPKPYSHEVTAVGDNLWLYRLRKSGICPTSRGPRRPEVAWHRTSELDQRFSSTRGRRDAGDLLPVFNLKTELPTNAVRSLCESLGVRTEITPSTFTIEDADLLCRQLERLYGDGRVDSTALSNVIKPTYRAMFELLSGQAGNVDGAPLGSTPLLTAQAGIYQFLPASEVLFVSTPGIKERTGLAEEVPVFVLEAEPAAVRPITSIFGSRVLERVLDWQPNPGECSLGSSELAEIRQGLRHLVAPLLARLRVERTRPSDRSSLLEFVEHMEPVDELGLTCTLDGEVLNRQNDRGYFVRPRTASEALQAFVVWEGSGWPPAPDAAQSLAMAIADTLGVNLVETFLAFITNDDRQRQQLLSIAGASGHYEDILDEFREGPVAQKEHQPTDAAPMAGSEPAATPAPTQASDERPAVLPDAPPPGVPPVPLHKFESLLLDGEPLIVAGVQAKAESQPEKSRRSDDPAGAEVPNRTQSGTDLEALDALGMRISIAYEARRLERSGGSVAIVTEGVLQEIRVSGAHETLVVDVHTPAQIARAEEISDVVKGVMRTLEDHGISRTYPGFDLLTIRDGEIDRLIELKSSGVDAKMQEMSWNEWKSASHSELRTRFWLYLAGNLRADLVHATPYLRAINDPFGSLVGKTVEGQQVRRAVQLRVREFTTAEHLDLTVTRHPDSGS